MRSGLEKREKNKHILYSVYTIESRFWIYVFILCMYNLGYPPLTVGKDPPLKIKESWPWVVEHPKVYEGIWHNYPNCFPNLMEKQVGTFDVIIGESKSAEEGGPQTVSCSKLTAEVSCEKSQFAKGRWDKYLDKLFNIPLDVRVLRIIQIFL